MLVPLLAHKTHWSRSMAVFWRSSLSRHHFKAQNNENKFQRMSETNVLHIVGYTRKNEILHEKWIKKMKIKRERIYSRHSLDVGQNNVTSSILLVQATKSCIYKWWDWEFREWHCLYTSVNHLEEGRGNCCWDVIYERRLIIMYHQWVKWLILLNWKLWKQIS